MVKKLFNESYEQIISVENLLAAWQDFLRGKRSRLDVQEFARQLMPNLFSLHESLEQMTYRHGEYTAFIISDPKTRSIHKATVRDRVLHRAIYRILYPAFDRTFIADSFSCRFEKGTHKALDRYKYFAGKASKNYHRIAWVLKCDVRKFFASIDHKILLQIVEERIIDKQIVWLLEMIVHSFSSNTPRVGLPLGNLTSQLLANVYLNVLDQFVKHEMHEKYYIRYADDFVILSDDLNHLEEVLLRVFNFLHHELHLDLHLGKIELRTVASGVDFLGWVHFPDHRILRPATQHRMFRSLAPTSSESSFSSYRGMLRHGNTLKIQHMLDDLQNANQHV